jgi:ABC-type antimicrobial peptide transport system permease subunit
MLIEDQVLESFTARRIVLFRAVAGGYLETIGMRLIRGRSIERGDVERNEPNIDRAAEQTAFTMVLIAIAGVVALMLGVIGVYGVMSYIVSQRTAEIGTRLALGAEPKTVANMIIRQGGIVALTGIGLGLAVAWASSRLLESLLYGVSSRDQGSSRRPRLPF